MKSEVIVFEDTFKVDIRSLELPRLGDHEVLIETHYSMVSPGTELRTLAGREKNADPFPLVPGYSTVGEVVEVGSKVRGLKLGTMAAVRGCRSLQPGLGCSWGGHAKHMISPQEEVFVLPEKANVKTAPLTILLATALHGVDLTNARIGEQVAVVGLGLVGQLCARLLAYAGANVVGTDLMPLRRKVAQDAGIRAVDASGDLRAAFSQFFSFGAEAVLDATGSSRAMKASLSLLREKPRQDPCGTNDAPGAGGADEGAFKRLAKLSHLQNEWHGPRFIAQGSYADPIEINYYDLFNSEVKFVVPRVHELKDLFRALDLLADPAFSLDGLITETHPFSNAPACYQRLREHPDQLITLGFCWK